MTKQTINNNVINNNKASLAFRVKAARLQQEQAAVHAVGEAVTMTAVGGLFLNAFLYWTGK